MRQRRLKAIAMLLIFSMLAGLFSGIGPSRVVQAASLSVDGVKDEAWNAMEPAAVSPEAGWSGFDIGNLYMTNDEEYLYFWLDAANVPNWGDHGQYVNLALQVNEADSGVAGNPWASQFHFGGTEAKPQFHVVMRVRNDSEVNWAAVYAASDLGTPLLASDNLRGAQFAINRSTGFEGKIPLSVLSLQHGDTIRPIAVLSGNNSAEHGAFDVAPRAEGNAIADGWNVSGAPNAQSVYGSPVTISIPGNEIPELPAISSPTYHDDGTVSVFTTGTSNEHWINGNFPATGGWSTFQPMTNVGTFMANGETVQLFRYTFSPADAQATGGLLQYKFSPVNAWNGDYLDRFNHAPLADGNSAVHYLFLEPAALQVEPGGTAAVKAFRFLGDGTKENISGGVAWASSQPDWAAVDAQGVVAVSADAVPGRTFVITAERNGVSVSKSYTVAAEVLRSPVVRDDGTVTFNNNTHPGETLHLVGSMNGWNNQGIAMTKNEQGVFSVTIPLDTGRYEYKFFPASGSWDNGFTDPLNPDTANGNSLLFVPGLTATPAVETVSPGQSVAFGAKFLAADGSETAVAPEWSLGAGAREGVAIDPATGLLTVQSSVVPGVDDSVTAVATYENGGRTYTAEATVLLASQTTTFVVHYFRYDQNYGDWNLWAWLDGREGQSFPAVTETRDGKTWARMTVDVAGDASKLNFIVRKGNWAEKEFSDRSLTATDGFGEVWVVEGDEALHDAYLPSLTDPAIRGAIADEAEHIKLTLTNKPPSYGTFEAWDGNRKLAGVSARGAHDKAVVITLDEPIADVRNVYTIKDASGEFKEKRVMMRGILDSFVYTGADLGVTYGPEASAFKVWAPTAVTVSVALYANATAADAAPDRLVPMTRDDATGVWSAVAEGDWEGRYYLYKIGFADGTTTYANDPYARAASANGLKTAIVDLSTTDPAHWKPESKPYMGNPTDAVIYELHVRDFSMNERSGITPEYRGKYKAFTQTGTTDPATGAKTGVDHLAELGVTHLHLLPTYDFGSIDETKVDDPAYAGRKFNWGYDPIHFNVPEGSYATDLSDPTARITEFKEMVQALHDRGIRVILDVVYNHTLASGQTNPASVFDKIVPGYYFRSDEKGRYTDGSGTGNEVASERPMVRKYILDSTRYWAEEYNVDGFRFDLMGLIDTPTMTEVARMLQQEVHPTMLVYGEPWVANDASALPSSLRTVKGTQRGKSFAVFNDNFRGAIKGGSDNDSKGFATGAGGTEPGIATGAKGSWEDFTDGPTETINYVTAHDNLNLWDKVIKTQHLEEQEGWVHIENGKLLGDEFASVEEAVAAATPHHAVDPNHVLDNETVKRSLLANGIAVTAQGIPFIHAGEELLRTKFGDHNSYASPDAINQIRWEYKTKFAPVFDYYEGLLKLRKEHPAFRMSTKEAVQQGFELLRANGNVVAYRLKNHANNDPWNNIVVIYNANGTDQSVTLPASASGAWNVVVNETAAGTEPLATVSGGSVTVKALSMMVLYDQAETPYTPEATTLQLDASSIALEAGMSKFIKAVALDQKGRPMHVPIEYASSDEQVAAVNGLGKVTGMTDGMATIAVSAGTLTAELTVVVGELVPTQLAVQGPSSLYAGDSVSLTAVVKDQYGQPMNGIPVSWSSSNSAVAGVAANGVVTGLAEGTATITASAGQVETAVTLQVKRPNAIALHYERPDGNFTDMDVWVWNTGLRNNDGHSVDFVAVDGTKAIALIPVGETATSVGFIVRKKDWSFKDTNQDRFIPVQPNEAVKKVVVTSGVVEYYTVPSIRSPQPSEGKLRFQYRDRDRFAMGTLGELSGVKAVVDGVERDAVYDELNEAWVYTFDAPQNG
ncbi:MAG TPA: type I pullulanase, partial [Paenibacillus sp.]|nr:type I pullulanase [Paenibacillus sp.]